MYPYGQLDLTMCTKLDLAFSSDKGCDNKINKLYLDLGNGEDWEDLFTRACKKQFSDPDKDLSNQDNYGLGERG